MTANPNIAPQIVSGLGPANDAVSRSSTAGRAPMQPAVQLDAASYQPALDCVHCGLCLPACPTYTQNGLEADSPRGRLHLMKGLADGRIAPTDRVIEHLDLCLDCRACETACPSGVKYHMMLSPTRTQLAGERRVGWSKRFVLAISRQVMAHPRRLRVMLAPVRLLQKMRLWRPITRLVSRLAPAPIVQMVLLAPEAERPVVQLTAKPAGKALVKVGLLTGCAASVLFDSVNQQTIALLSHAGCEVIVPPAQRCCGAIHHHSGDDAGARRFALANLDAFEKAGVDWVVSNAAGCGAMLKEYAQLFQNDPAQSARAAHFAKKTRDICELLAELDFDPLFKPLNMTATYHDACHLAHGQGVVNQPRALLAKIPGLKLIPLAESEICCGAAGTYNLTQPEMARQLGDRKIEHIRRTGARVCITGNIGCALQIKSQAQLIGLDLRVVHPVTVLYEALR